jgi:D-alanine-D-alanine ligase
VIPVDVFFPAFHGAHGENGCIQGLLELADVVYSGSDVVSSAVSMSKYHCKKFLESHGIPALPSVLLSREGLDENPGARLESWRNAVISAPGFETFPLFVKPANLGSSIGVARVTDVAGLDAALLQAFKYDHQVLVEPCVESKLEINVAVIDDTQVRASVVEIPVSSSGNELSYEDKYMRGGGKKTGNNSLGMAGLTRVIDPTDLDPTIKALAQDYASRSFTALGCAGVARIDFIMDLASKQLYFNEINPIPGSFANYLWVKSAPALLFTDLITLCIERAIKRDKMKRALSHDLGFKALFK